MSDRPYFSSVRSILMLFLVLSGVGLVGLVGIGCAIGANTCIVRQHPQTSMDGHVLWLANCASCHGRSGAGRKAGPALIRGDAAKLSLSELEALARNGRPLKGMPSFRRVMKPQQIRAVAEYVLILRGSPSPSPSASSSASPSPSASG